MACLPIVARLSKENQRKNNNIDPFVFPFEHRMCMCLHFKNINETGIRCCAFAPNRKKNLFL